MKLRIVHLKSMTRVSDFNACSALVLPVGRKWDMYVYISPFLPLT